MTTASAAQANRAADPHTQQIRAHVQQASELLCLANQKGVRIPREVLGSVLETERVCAKGRAIDLELETRFWDAYGLLRRTIEPATQARRFYRIVFYAALFLMLLVQGAFLIGSRVHDRLMQLPPAASVASAPSDAGLMAGQSAPAVFQMAGQVVTVDDGSVLSRSQLLKVLFKTKLDFVATYLLPLLYGLLGACAFVLRQLCEDVSSLRFADDSRVRYTLRLNIGMLAGLAVGWFIDPTEGGSEFANLSPLALAFVAGYGSDLVFALMDRVVGGFTTPTTASAAAQPRS